MIDSPSTLIAIKVPVASSLSTARLDSTTEVLFVADTVAQEMNMYAFIPAAGAIELVQKFDLRALDRINQPPKDVQERGNRRERGR